jgi:hypothetical protein
MEQTPACESANETPDFARASDGARERQRAVRRRTSLLRLLKQRRSRPAHNRMTMCTFSFSLICRVVIIEYPSVAQSPGTDIVDRIIGIAPTPLLPGERQADLASPVMNGDGLSLVSRL